MAVQETRLPTEQKSGSSIIYDPFWRGVAFQILLAIALIWAGYEIVTNTVENLRRINVAAGFDFLSRRSGFDISQSLIDYNSDYSYGRAFVVGLLNTLLVAVIGIILATILGFIVGIARLSPNWLLRKVATIYVETFRNIPLLLQLLFWYKAVLAVLPPPRTGIDIAGIANLNNRGLIVPSPVTGDNFQFVFYALVIAVIGVIFLRKWATARQMATGQQFPVFAASLGLIIGFPLIVYLLTGMPLTFEYPVLKGFNFAGGTTINPEFMALVLGLSIYTASFIAEIVRAGIMAVSRGQSEAAFALGLRPGVTTRLVIVPQAMRVVIPPLTSQYLNITKNSSLAVAIGYPDLVSVFSGTVLNQTGQAVEVILITMLVYLTISLATSGFMNWFNSRVRLVER